MKAPLTLFQRHSSSVDGMTGGFLAHFTLALTGAMVLAAPALPQDVSVPCSLCTPAPTVADERPAAPVKLDVEVNLDFDRLVLSGSGDGIAELRPDGARSVSGSIASMSARAMVGEVVIRGEPNRYVRIDLPRRIELQGYSGGVIRLESLRSDLPQMPRLDGDGRLRFRLGGVLHLSGDVSGEFRGDVTIDVDYL